MGLDTKFKEALKAVESVTLGQDIAKTDQNKVTTGSWSRQVHS